MKVSQIQDYDTHAIVGGGLAQSFRMAETAEFFTVLSDTLYTNKKRAMIREIVCNAWDAHLMLGKADVPIEIEVGEAEVVVRDYGPGIPHDKIVDVYCVYGASTKVHDDEQTGGFGLGSKAPFAYSDHFTVENCHAGLRTVYAISRGSSETEGRPDIREMVSVPTDKTGVTVTVPVQKKSDAWEFTRITKNVIRQGGMRALINSEEFVGLDYKSVREKGFGYMTEQTAYEIGLTEANVYCLYGTVLYPVSASDDRINELISDIDMEINPDTRYRGHSVKAVTILSARPHSVGVTPSREALSYTDRTVNTLKRLLKKAIFEIRAAKRMAEDAVREKYLSGEDFSKKPWRLNPDRGNHGLKEVIRECRKDHGLWFTETDAMNRSPEILTDQMDIGTSVMLRKDGFSILSLNDRSLFFKQISRFAPHRKRAARIFMAKRSRPFFRSDPWRQALLREEKRKMARITRDLVDLQKVAILRHERGHEAAKSVLIKRASDEPVSPVIVISEKRFQAEEFIKQRDELGQDTVLGSPDYSREIWFFSVLMNPDDQAAMKKIRERAEKFGYSVHVVEKVKNSRPSKPKRTEKAYPTFLHLNDYCSNRNLPKAELSEKDVTHYIYEPLGMQAVSTWGDISLFKDHLRKAYGTNIALVTRESDRKRIEKTVAVDLVAVLRDQFLGAMKHKDFALAWAIMTEYAFDECDSRFSNHSSSVQGYITLKIANKEPAYIPDIFKRHVVNRNRLLEYLRLARLFEETPRSLKNSMKIEPNMAEFRDKRSSVIEKIGKDERMKKISLYLSLCKSSYHMSENHIRAIAKIAVNIDKVL
jgi:hypothetical protein